MRLSRKCYDKPHRCPGDRGGGMHFAHVIRCVNGRLDAGWDWLDQLQFHRCATCGVITWPLVTRWLDRSWWTFKLWCWRRDWHDWREDRRLRS